MTIEEAKENINKTVLYNAYPGTGGAEVGVITSVNTTYVFVRFGADLHSKAVYPDDLELEF